MRNQNKFKRTAINAAISTSFNQSLTVDNTGDEELLGGENYNWDNLQQLKNELGKCVYDLTMNIRMIIMQPAVYNNLGPNKEHFDRVVGIYMKDITDFSERVAKLRVEHETRVGPVTSLEDFNVYNRIALSYSAMYSELMTLLAPAISEIILLIPKEANESTINNTVQTEEQPPAFTVPVIN